MKKNRHKNVKKNPQAATGPVTQPTLLEGVKNRENHNAWDRFFELYSPLILGFSNSRGCSPEMAKEVLQETMICLLTELPKFEYNPKRGLFRSYLLGVVNHRIQRAFQREKYYLKRHNSLDEMQNQGVEIDRCMVDTHYDHPSCAWDDLWTKNLALQALRQVQKRVGPVPYRSFELNVLKSWSVKEIAAELGLTSNEIYQHKDRLKKILRQEYQTLIAEVGE